MYDIISLGEMLLPELRKIAEKHGVQHKGLKKQDLAYKILDYQAVNPDKFKDVKPKADGGANIDNAKLEIKDTSLSETEDKKNTAVSKKPKIVQQKTIFLRLMANQITQFFLPLMITKNINWSFNRDSNL